MACSSPPKYVGTSLTGLDRQKRFSDRSEQSNHTPCRPNQGHPKVLKRRVYAMALACRSHGEDCCRHDRIFHCFGVFFVDGYIYNIYIYIRIGVFLLWRISRARYCREELPLLRLLSLGDPGNGPFGVVHLIQMPKTLPPTNMQVDRWTQERPFSECQAGACPLLFLEGGYFSTTACSSRAPGTPMTPHPALQCRPF